MLKTNSKKTRENIRNYIMSHATPEVYTETPPETWPELAAFILEHFRSEKYSILEDFRYYGGSEQKAFADWCAGLPSILDTCYYWNRSAVDDLGDILEQTQAERSKYSETEAENTLTYLIYRELLEGERKNEKV